ncbi:uncharacterized protein CTHT_0055930 [Thermochaetoides thermophila DSM 1495]|uniref:Uncharacterized protein n=1 Tax=Chaetomium thermophilum (strain DSM 1495 / CBS 144.50 / IMI 039719) TaxID=759272 RepID=G0SC49_CHATD|nr:hypothetical protein CTHT_0055930 [Thermochaetoides thermophila DSM 1495]EGS18975.1 hypothetical protein CTHT_0055930 [Thermochaetoides thermophila DSM 1495]
MPRHIDQDVHSAFVEFRGDDPSAKCLSVQCIYCQQTRAKNTTRQKQHLLQCAPYLQAHPDVALQISGAASAASAQASQAQAQAQTQANVAVPGQASGDAPADGTYTHDGTVGEHTALTFVPNPRINGTPSQGRPSLGGDGTPAPKRQKTKPTPSNMPEISLQDVHKAFVEFRANETDKCLSARCIYCNQVRAKNTSRQREHLLTCPGYQSILKDKIPANNLRHQFDQDDVASTLALPAPTMDLDFRISIKVKPKLNIGPSPSGRQSWIPCIGGQWAGRWGKGTILSGGHDIQTSVKDTATRIDAQFLLQTNDEHPAQIVLTMKGWLTAERDVMERLQDPVAADNVVAHRYRLRVTLQLETGDERYADVNTGVWVGSGCRRGGEIVYDAYRIS